MDGSSGPGKRLTTEQFAKEIYRALPADSYQHIATKIRRNTGTYLTKADVTVMIHIIRHAPRERFGWTIPYCKRGRSSPDRLFVQLYDTDTPFDADTLKRYNEGRIGTLSYTFSLASTTVDSLDAALQQMPTLALRRRARDVLKDLRHIADKIWDMREDCREDTGTI